MNTSGAPLTPRLVTAVAPRLSETWATMVVLYPCCADPGGRCVRSWLDEDAPIDTIVIQRSLRCARRTVVAGFRGAKGGAFEA